MKKEILLTVGLAAAVALPFVIDKHCQHTGYPEYVWVIYLAALFLFWICWAALCVLEKEKPSLLSVVGANLGLCVLVFSVVIAFINIKWWIVLLFLPFAWSIGGWLGGRVVRFIPAAWMYFALAVGLFSLIFHTYYKI